MKRMIKDYTKFANGKVCIILRKEIETMEEQMKFLEELENINGKGEDN